jgi:hypothetical protein
MYNMKQGLDLHIEKGDPGTDRQAEILPHPYCDFCNEYFFNDLIFFDHLNRSHLQCHLCPQEPAFKTIYYANYESLENHFAWSHYICPFDQCKSKCYVAFRTEAELETHVAIEHKVRSSVAGGKATAGGIHANALLAFDTVREEDEEGYGGRRGGRGGRGGREQ